MATEGPKVTTHSSDPRISRALDKLKRRQRLRNGSFFTNENENFSLSNLAIPPRHVRTIIHNRDWQGFKTLRPIAAPYMTSPRDHGKKDILAAPPLLRPSPLSTKRKELASPAHHILPSTPLPSSHTTHGHHSTPAPPRENVVFPVVHGNKRPNLSLQRGNKKSILKKASTRDQVLSRKEEYNGGYLHDEMRRNCMIESLHITDRAKLELKNFTLQREVDMWTAKVAALYPEKLN